MSDKNNTLKLVAFVLLLAQSTSVVLVIRYSKISVSTTEVYTTSTAIFFGEALKVLICMFKIMYDNYSEKSGLSLLKVPIDTSFLDNPVDSLQMAVPAVLFAVQNNLLFFALANLQASVYQVLYQVKILTTALFLVAMLGRRLSKQQWGFLFSLFCGVVLTQVKFDNSEASTNSISGIVAISGACCTSGFASVYMEKVVKRTAPTIWVRNVQLGVFGMLGSLAIIATNDYDTVVNQGFFHGYNSLTWVTISLHSAGGIIIAVVIKYADNLVKTIATALSIVLSAIVSYLFLDFILTPQFVLGAMVVLGSAFGYSTSPSGDAPTKIETPQLQPADSCTVDVDVKLQLLPARN